MVELLGYVGVGIIGFVAGIFVYRNNTAKLSKIANKVDALYDYLEDKALDADKNP